MGGSVCPAQLMVKLGEVRKYGKRGRPWVDPWQARMRAGPARRPVDVGIDFARAHGSFCRV